MCIIHVVYAHTIFLEQWLKNDLHCTCIHHISNAHLSSYDEGRYYTHFDKIVALASFVSSPGPLMAKGLPVTNFVSCVRILECVFFSIHRQFFKWVYARIK